MLPLKMRLAHTHKEPFTQPPSSRVSSPADPAVPRSTAAAVSAQRNRLEGCGRSLLLLVLKASLARRVLISAVTPSFAETFAAAARIGDGILRFFSRCWKDARERLCARHRTRSLDGSKKDSQPGFVVNGLSESLWY